MYLPRYEGRHFAILSCRPVPTDEGCDTTEREDGHMTDAEQPPAPGYWKASDGRWYPPQQAPSYAPPFAVAPVVSRSAASGCLKAFIIVAVLGIALVVAAVAGVIFIGNNAAEKLSAVGSELEAADGANDPGGAGTTSPSDEAAHPARDDVEISECRDGEYGPEVTVRITNHTATRANYVVEVSLLDDAGTKIGEATGFENNVEASQTAVSDLVASASGTTWTKCQLVNVQRFAG